MAEAAHRIKGSSLTVGAARIASQAAEIETAARAGDISSAAERASSLAADLDPTREALFAEFGIQA